VGQRGSSLKAVKMRKKGGEELIMSQEGTRVAVRGTRRGEGGKGTRREISADAIKFPQVYNEETGGKNKSPFKQRLKPQSPKNPNRDSSKGRSKEVKIVFTSSGNGKKAKGGLGSPLRAQASIANGKPRNGGKVNIVRYRGTSLERRGKNSPSSPGARKKNKTTEGREGGIE